MIGEKIKEYRKEKRLGQRDLAKLLKVANGTISLWENNLRVPDLDTIKDISTVLEVPIHELLELENTAEKKEMPELTPQQKILLENITKLTDIECIKVNGYIEGLILNRINEKHSTLINISEE